MNERIKQLAEQAEDYAAEQPSPYTHYQRMLRYEIFKEKFAELIVKECVQWVDDNLGLVDEEAKADLLKHFGVEE